MRTWKCPACGHTEEIGYDWLAEHGGPVCQQCDREMELQSTSRTKMAAIPLVYRNVRFGVVVPARDKRTISLTLATFKETDTADDVDWSKTAEVVIEQTPCHLRIILDPQGEEHDLLIEQRVDRWAIFAHLPGGGDPFCIIETTDRRAVLLDGDDGRELLTRGIPDDRHAPVAADRDAVVERLVERADAAGLKPEDFDEPVHEFAASIAADVNNGGLDDQIRYLVDGLGAQHAERQIDELIESLPRGEEEDHDDHSD